MDFRDFVLNTYGVNIDKLRKKFECTERKKVCYAYIQYEKANLQDKDFKKMLMDAYIEGQEKRMYNSVPMEKFLNKFMTENF